MLFERSEFISFSVTTKKFSSYFGEHDSFRSFLTLRKELLSSFAACLPAKAGLDSLILSYQEESMIEFYLERRVKKRTF
jgi:hypothetical protein